MTQCAIVPDFDIPAAFISDDARQFRFSTEQRQMIMGMHLVGYLEKDGKDWYLIKDSGPVHVIIIRTLLNSATIFSLLIT